MNDQEIDVWQVEHDGTSCYVESNLEVVFDLIRDSDVGSEYKITHKRMLASKYNELPEFMGF